MKDSLTDITVVLDRSGSMQAVEKDTKGGFDKFVQDQKAVPGDANFTLVQFDTEYEFVHKAKPIKDVPPLDFHPRGNTALLDAVGKAIVETGERLEKTPESDRAGKVVFVIITDGEENSSREYKKDQIKKMIEQQTKVYNWQFVFLGANQDSFAEAGSMGIAMAGTMNFAPSAAGVANSYQSTSINLKAFRMGTVQNMAYSAQDRKAAMEDDDQTVLSK